MEHRVEPCVKGEQAQGLILERNLKVRKRTNPMDSIFDFRAPTILARQTSPTSKANQEED